MAITTINLSDPISTLVSKTNTISTNLGDVGTLTTPTTSSLVAALNEVNARLNAVDDAAELATQVEAEFVNTVFTAGGLSADSANIDSATVTNLNTTSIRTATITWDSDDIVLAHLKPLEILTSSGTVLKAGYLLSTSADAATL